IVRTDAAGPLAPEALYGFGWSELELGRFEAAAAAFRQFLAAWPEHSLTPAATVQLARALIEDRHVAEALPLLSAFATKYPGSKLRPDAQYLLGWGKYKNGDPQGALSDRPGCVAAKPDQRQDAASSGRLGRAAGKYGHA